MKSLSSYKSESTRSTIQRTHWLLTPLTTPTHPPDTVRWPLFLTLTFCINYTLAFPVNVFLDLTSLLDYFSDVTRWSDGLSYFGTSEPEAEGQVDGEWPKSSEEKPVNGTSRKPASMSPSLNRKRKVTTKYILKLHCTKLVIKNLVENSYIIIYFYILTDRIWPPGP